MSLGSDTIDGTCSLWGYATTGEAVYGWEAPSTGEFCFDLLDSSFDTSLAIFDESCGAELACDGDGHGSGGGYTSYTSASLDEGQVVTIVIDSYSSLYGGSDTYALMINEGPCM